MKLLLISIISLLCLTAILADETDKISSESDELDVVELAKDDSDTKTSEAQRKRDSGYSYTRPDRLSSSRYESSGIRGRIVSKYPSSQTVRPFNRYGPPKHTSPQFGKPSDQYAPQHLHIGGYRQQYRPARPQQQGSQFGGGQMHQGVPSPIRTYDFVEPSPIASQNNEPFNSNAANYLPPRNQKLPGYSNPNQFSNQQQSTQIHEVHQIQNPSNLQQEQNFNNQQQSQQLIQGQFQDQQQISDATLFLQQNAQAISQLYESPATNLNYEPFHESQGPVDQSQNPNNQFQTFNVNNASPQSLQNAAGFQGSLPSYASGFLDNQQTLEQVQSLEKDRLIAQLQRALAQGNSDSSAASSARYAQNHPTGSYIQSQSLLASLGTQINPSAGPQLDKPNGFNGQRPFGGGNSGFGQGSFLPTTGTTASGLPITYGLPSTTPATQSPSTTTTATSTTPSQGPQRPLQGATGAGSSQVGTSAPAPGTPLTFPFPQYGGFVPTLIGTNLLTSSYPTYGTNFLASGSPSITSVQSSGSSPTHFGIPIPTAPAATQGSSGSSGSSGTSSSTKPQAPPQQHPHPSTPIHTIPVQPIQPIHPIAATPIHPVFPVAPSVTQVHPIQSPVPVASGHPTYGLQPAAVNPILIKPVKYPVYYYPNIYQVQKPAVATLPWTYAPAYAQAKPQQIWK